MEGVNRIKKQSWFCEVCGKSGEVEFSSEDGVYSVVYKLADAHRESSPGKLAGMSKSGNSTSSSQ